MHPTFTDLLIHPYLSLMLAMSPKKILKNQTKMKQTSNKSKTKQKNFFALSSFLPHQYPFIYSCALEEVCHVLDSFMSVSFTSMC